MSEWRGRSRGRMGIFLGRLVISPFVGYPTLPARALRRRASWRRRVRHVKETYLRRASSPGTKHCLAGRCGHSKSGTGSSSDVSADESTEWTCDFCEAVGRKVCAEQLSSDGASDGTSSCAHCCKHGFLHPEGTLFDHLKHWHCVRWSPSTSRVRLGVLRQGQWRRWCRDACDSCYQLLRCRKREEVFPSTVVRRVGSWYPSL